MSCRNPSTSSPFSRQALAARLASIVLLVAAAGCAVPEEGPLVVGTLERERVEMVAEASERIVEVNVREGTRVEAGAVVMRLDAELLQTDVAVARANRERAEQRLAELVRGPRSEQIDRAQAELEAAVRRLATERQEYERVRTLVDRRIMTPADLDRVSGAVDVWEANVDAAEARLAELLDGTTREELAQARAGLAEAEARLGRAELQVDRMTVRTLRAGVIDAIPYRLGERPPMGAVVAVVLAEGAPYARVYVPEPLRSQVRPGTVATVSVDGAASTFPGTVRWVSSEASFTPYFALTQRDRSRLSYVAEIVLDGDAALELPAGLPVEVDFPGIEMPSADGSR